MYIPTIDGAAVLQAETTKDASFDSAALDLGETYAPGERSLGRLAAAVVDVDAVTLATPSPTQTYAFKLQDSANGSSWADIGVPVSVTGPGVVVVKGIIARRHVRVVLTVGGTGTKSITYTAHLGL